MLKIKFYENGYEIYGHIHPVHCGEVSAMAYFCNGMILDADKSARCFSGDNKGYTGAVFNPENDKALYYYERFKEDLKRWAEDCFNPQTYKIKLISKKVKLEKIVAEAKKRGLDYDFETIESQLNLQRSFKDYEWPDEFDWKDKEINEFGGTNRG